VRVDEALEQRPLLGARLFREPLRAPRRQVLLHRRARSLERAVGGCHGRVEQGRRLVGRPAEDVAINAARCRGGRSCVAARNASSIVSRSRTAASGWSSLGATSSSNRSGYGWNHGTSAKECIVVRRRELRLSMSRQTFVAMR
jgi:hypothetical protein